MNQRGLMLKATGTILSLWRGIYKLCWIYILIHLLGNFEAKSQVYSETGELTAKKGSMPDNRSLLDNLILNEEDPGLIKLFDNSSSSFSLFTVLSTQSYSILYIFAPNGEVLYYRVLENYAYDFKLLPDGTISWFDQGRMAYVIMDKYLNETDLIPAMNGYSTDFHEFRLHEGGYFLLAEDVRNMDLSAVIEGGHENASVAGNVIQKIDSNKNVIFEWNSFDHFDLTDSYSDLSSQIIDAVHINSIELDTDSTILISSRNLNEITKINLNTGEIIWRMGGKNNEFEFIDFDRPFAGQHTLRRREGKIYTLFDNGLDQDPQYSRGLVMEIDEELMQVKLLHEFRHSPEVYSRIVGNLQNPGNGNYLVYWGVDRGFQAEGIYTVYNEEYKIIEEGKFTNTEVPAYRVFKFDWRPKNFTSTEEVVNFPDTEEGDTSIFILQLRNNTQKAMLIDELIWKDESFQVNTSGPVILFPNIIRELPVRFNPLARGFIEDTLTLRSNGKSQGSGIQVVLRGKGVKVTGMQEDFTENVVLYPMPFNDLLHYKSPKPIKKLQLTGIEGDLILERQNLEEQGVVNTGMLHSGVYILMMQFEGDEMYRKIVIKE
jgi:hypothetical protein